MGFFGEPTQKPNAHAYLKLVQASAWAAKHEKQRTAKTQHRLFERCFFITFFMHSINIYRVRTIIIYFFIRYPSRHLQVVWQGEDMFPTLFFCVAVMEWNAGTKRVYIGPFHDSLRYPPYPPSPCLISFLHRLTGYLTSERVLSAFTRWRHFTTTTRILQAFAFLCKLELLLLKPHWITKFKYERKNGMNFGRSSKKDVIVQMACLMVC